MNNVSSDLTTTLCNSAVMTYIRLLELLSPQHRINKKLLTMRDNDIRIIDLIYICFDNQVQKTLLTIGSAEG